MKLSIAPCSPTSKKGFSLAEVLIGMALMSLIMLAMHRVLISGIRYLNQTTLTTELQQACVLASSRVVTELLESSKDCIRGDDTYHLFVSFALARDSEGQTSFDAATGELNWHYYVGYYVATVGEEPALYRKDKLIDPPTHTPPPIAVEMDEKFWINRPEPARKIAERVYYLDVVSSTNINVILGVKSRDNRFLININTKLKARN